ncbi:MAG TPA: nuclear transport factor 2 family protein [Solirubrobacteraceae bacterium]|jgi:hypothetical protein
MLVINQLGFETAADTFNARELDRFAEQLADDIVFDAPGKSCATGKEACVAFYDDLFQAFPDAQFDVRELYVIDEIVVEEGTFIGTHTGVGRTNRTISIEYVQVLRYREGELVALNLKLDRLLMLEQLGLITEPERLW